MKKRIVTYRKRIDELLKLNKSTTDWKFVLQGHLIQIKFFQHERLVHLIVTMTVAILFLISVGVTVITEYLPLLAVALLLLVLLIPYILHYYTLENEVQKMYAQYDELLLHCHVEK